MQGQQLLPVYWLPSSWEPGDALGVSGWAGQVSWAGKPREQSAAGERGFSTHMSLLAPGTRVSGFWGDWGQRALWGTWPQPAQSSRILYDSVLVRMPFVSWADGMAKSYPGAGIGPGPLSSLGPVRPGRLGILGVTGRGTGQGWRGIGFRCAPGPGLFIFLRS